MEENLLQEPEEDQPGREVIIIFAVFFEGGLAPLSLALGWLLGRPPLDRFAWSARDALYGVAAVIPLVLMFLAMLRWPIGPLRRVKRFLEVDVVPLLERSSWAEIALVAVAAGVGEEMLFRGVVQPWLGSRIGTAGGLCIAALLFGLLHPISVVYMVIAALLGLYLGALWLLGGNLLMVIVTHALFDFIALAYLIRIQPFIAGDHDTL
jgi:membrane protease YdiL (CAAX protease family)